MKTISVHTIEPKKNGPWGGGIQYLTCLKTLGSSPKRGMKEIGRREEWEREGGRREGMVEGRGGDKDTLFTHLFCAPTS